MQLLQAFINELNIRFLQNCILNGLVVDFCLDLLHTILLGLNIFFDPFRHIRDQCSKECSEEEHNILDHESGDNEVQP